MAPSRSCCAARSRLLRRARTRPRRIRRKVVRRAARLGRPRAPRRERVGARLGLAARRVARRLEPGPRRVLPRVVGPRAPLVVVGPGAVGPAVGAAVAHAAGRRGVPGVPGSSTVRRDGRAGAGEVVRAAGRGVGQDAVGLRELRGGGKGRVSRRKWGRAQGVRGGRATGDAPAGTARCAARASRTRSRAHLGGACARAGRCREVSVAPRGWARSGERATHLVELVLDLLAGGLLVHAEDAVVVHVGRHGGSCEVWASRGERAGEERPRAARWSRSGSARAQGCAHCAQRGRLQHGGRAGRCGRARRAQGARTRATPSSSSTSSSTLLCCAPGWLVSSRQRHGAPQDPPIVPPCQRRSAAPRPPLLPRSVLSDAGTLQACLPSTSALGYVSLDSPEPRADAQKVMAALLAASLLEHLRLVPAVTAPPSRLLARPTPPRNLCEGSGEPQWTRAS